MNWALTTRNRDQRQRRVPASKTLPNVAVSDACGQSHHRPHECLTARTWLTLATAVTPAGEAHLLALQVQRLHHIFEPPKSAQRE
jgi:hypothetical protein